MCDLTQFVVSTITTETHAEHLAKKFMENIVLSFSMVATPVVDYGIRFKRIFKDMCAFLVIIYWLISHGDHKGMSIENYPRFLNKTQAIAVQDRGTHGVFL